MNKFLNFFMGDALWVLLVTFTNILTFMVGFITLPLLLWVSGIEFSEMFVRSPDTMVFLIISIFLGWVSNMVLRPYF